MIMDCAERVIVQRNNIEYSAMIALNETKGFCDNGAIFMNTGIMFTCSALYACRVLLCFSGSGGT